MTSLLTILSIIGLIAICWAVGKYNKSDNLFWILLVSLLAGMAGGALVNKLDSKSNDEVRTYFTTQVYNPTQVSPAIYVEFDSSLGDIRAHKAKPVIKDELLYDSKVESSTAPSKTSGEIRGQPTKFTPFDTS